MRAARRAAALLALLAGVAGHSPDPPPPSPPPLPPPPLPPNHTPVILNIAAACLLGLCVVIAVLTLICYLDHRPSNSAGGLWHMRQVKHVPTTEPPPPREIITIENVSRPDLP